MVEIDGQYPPKHDGGISVSTATAAPPKVKPTSRMGLKMGIGLHAKPIAPAKPTKPKPANR
jgi:hypothetical protein